MTLKVQGRDAYLKKHCGSNYFKHIASNTGAW